MKAYILDNEAEFERLEKQSKTDLYDHKNDLKGVEIPEYGDFLDLGCGSGIIARYLATRYPRSRVIGVDASQIRVKQASEKARKDLPGSSNLSFEVADATRLQFEDNSFDFIICRYVFHHFDSERMLKAAREIFRCLKPGGKVCIVDIDGAFLNIHPQTPVMQKVLKGMEQSDQVDYRVGRKLPTVLSRAGFKDVTWCIHAVDFQGENRQVELELNRERFLGFQSFLLKILGNDPAKVEQFSTEYLSTMADPKTVAFYDRFIVVAHKEAVLRLGEVKPLKSTSNTLDKGTRALSEAQKSLPQYPEPLRRYWDSAWGHYHDFSVIEGTPIRTVSLPREKSALKIVLFVSYSFGRLVLEAMLERQKTQGDIEIVGVVTDDVLDPKAKISKKKRLWKDIPEEKHAHYQNAVEHLALSHRIPVYTGQVKPLEGAPSTLFTNHILERWSPDLILVTGFGQKISKEILARTPYGVYNIHTSDASRSETGELKLHYTGVAPLTEMIKDARSTTTAALHHVSEDIDMGHVVGLSSRVSLYQSATKSDYIDVETFLERLGYAAQEVAHQLIDAVRNQRKVVYQFD